MLGGASLAGLAGCVGFGTRSARTPPLVADRPDAVYYPTHWEGMKTVNVREQNGYRCALTYSYAHRFWLMKPSGITKVGIQPEDSIHLMPVVWDTETGVIPPDVNPQLTITQDGETVDQFAPWPMLSQPMGFHFGDNAQLDGDGTYTVNVSIGGTSTRRTGTLADNEGNASFSFELGFSQAKLEEIAYTDIPADKQGTKGAVELMDMEMLPDSTAPKPDALPGTVRGSATSGDAQFVVTAIEDATRFGGSEDQTYLAVSPRTPYNRTILPMMSLSGTVARGDETAFDGYLQSTLDPELRYHYGAFVPDVRSGDQLTITVDSPPQTARHEGYETAFVEIPAMELSL